ncbi:haloacid dehalogenase type II [Microaerobacter geothermalis]|uniref:haloacid dehalogenase type II n=1 Tax=Microaerobacter geothermalis TaxID=674972 RepID=UPI0038B23EA6
MATIKAFVFDAYGTLFNVHSVIELCNRLFPGQGEELSEIWRSKQLEYTWLRSLMGRYVHFGKVTEDALVFACKHLELTLDESMKERLMEEYKKLRTFPEVPEVLKLLNGKKRVIFSNGSPDILKPVVHFNGLDDHIDDILTVDDAKVYKPDPKSYTVVLEKLHVKREEVLFISSNPWDAAGAKSFGFHVAWVNRNNKTMDELNQSPDIIVSDLYGVLQI